MNTADYEVHNTLRTWYYICFKKFALGLFNDYFTLKLLFLDPVIRQSRFITSEHKIHFSYVTPNTDNL